MSKRRNIVILNGPLYLEELTTVNLDGNEVPVAVCAAETDHPALGGRHRVLAYGRLAQEVAAFVQAAGHNPLDCTVDGWLRSTPDDVGNWVTVVIADKITFHAGAEVAAKARRLLARAGLARPTHGARGPIITGARYRAKGPRPEGGEERIEPSNAV